MLLQWSHDQIAYKFKDCIFPYAASNYAWYSNISFLRLCFITTNIFAEYQALQKRQFHGSFATCLSNGTTVESPLALQTALVFDQRNNLFIMYCPFTWKLIALRCWRDYEISCKFSSFIQDRDWHTQWCWLCGRAKRALALPQLPYRFPASHRTGRASTDAQTDAGTNHQENYQKTNWSGH